MSIKYVINTSIWIEYFAGDKKTKKMAEIIEKEDIGTSIVSIAELADKFEREDMEFGEVLKFIMANATILPISIEIAMLAAKLKKQIRKKNEKFGLADALHLASAKIVNAIFVTADNDFKNVDGSLVV